MPRVVSRNNRISDADRGICWLRFPPYAALQRILYNARPQFGSFVLSCVSNVCFECVFRSWATASARVCVSLGLCW